MTRADIGDIVENWFVAYTGPNLEEKADKSLRDEGYATFLPFDRIRRRKAVRGRPGCFVVDWENVPLFPRYLFVGARPRQGLFAANEAEGVATILHFGDRPVVVPHRVIDEIMMRADSDGIVQRRDLTVRKEFKEGQRVGFAPESPFASFIGVVEKDAGREVRLWLEGLARGQKLSVDPALIHEI